MPTIRERVAASQLPTDDIIICGSGIMDALGLREAEDVDIVASEALFSTLQESGQYDCGELNGDHYCRKGEVKNGGETIAVPYDGVEIWGTWYGKSYDEVATDVEIIDGLRYMSVEKTIEWKRQKARDKDFRDIKLLEDYCAK